MAVLPGAARFRKGVDRAQTRAHVDNFALPSHVKLGLYWLFGPPVFGHLALGLRVKFWELDSYCSGRRSWIEGLCSERLRARLTCPLSCVPITHTLARVCRAAHLLLAGHGAHFCVSYPLRIGDASADGVAGRYVWQLQAFPATRGCYPARWAPALALALAAREGGGAPTEAQASELLDSQSPTTLASVGAGGGVTALPVASSRATGAVAGWADLADLAWWRSQSMHSYADGDASHAPAVEWRPECTLHFVAPVNEVRGTLAADSSLVETAAGGLLVRHVTAPGDEGSTTLATAGVPDHIYTRSPGASAGADAGRVRVPLGPAARRAVAMRAAAAAGAVAAEQAAKQSALVADSAGGSQLSATVLTRVEVPREGAFSAYADGRVRVQFRDRTLLELDAARETADVILPDGSRQVVRCAAPVGCGRYVADALQFAAWAFKSPDERAEVMRAQRRVDGQLAANARHEAVCTLAVSGRYEGPAGIVADEAPRAAPPAVVPVDRLDSTEADDARRGREAARVAGAGTTEGGGATGSSVECAAEESLAPLARRDGGGAGCAAPPVPRVPAAEWDALLPGGSSTAAGRQLLVEEMLKRNDEHMRRLAEVLETN